MAASRRSWTLRPSAATGSGENPARWKGHLKEALPTSSRVRRVKHHAALPYNEIGAFVADLRQREGRCRRCPGVRYPDRRPDRRGHRRALVRDRHDNRCLDHSRGAYESEGRTSGPVKRRKP